MTDTNFYLPQEDSVLKQRTHSTADQVEIFPVDLKRILKLE